MRKGVNIMPEENLIADKRILLTESQMIEERQNRAEDERLEERAAEPVGVGGEGQPGADAGAMFNPATNTYMELDENGMLVEAGHEEGEIETGKKNSEGDF